MTYIRHNSHVMTINNVLDILFFVLTIHKKAFVIINPLRIATSLLVYKNQSLHVLPASSNTSKHSENIFYTCTNRLLITKYIWNFFKISTLFTLFKVMFGNSTLLCLVDIRQIDIKSYSTEL